MTTAQKVELTVPVQDGRLNPTALQKQLLNDFIRTRDGKAVVVKLSRPVNSRSLQANKYYWGVVLGTIAAETGNTTEDLHVVLKDKFLPRKFITLAGKEVEVRKSTAELSIDEFSKYLEQLAAFAASELGITLPDRP